MNSPQPTKGSEMLRQELMGVINRWINEADIDYDELLGTLEIIKMTYWQDWTEKKRAED